MARIGRRPWHARGSWIKGHGGHVIFAYLCLKIVEEKLCCLQHAPKLDELSTVFACVHHCTRVVFLVSGDGHRRAEDYINLYTGSVREAKAMLDNPRSSPPVYLGCS